MKRVFPTVWFGMLIIVTVAAALGMSASHQMQPVFFLIPAFMFVLGYYFMKRLVFGLMDEVWDAGNELVVKNHGEEVRIPLVNIMNVSFMWITNPNIITLRLRQPCRFGKELMFCPKGMYFLPFSKNPVAEQLIERVDALRHT